MKRSPLMRRAPLKRGGWLHRRSKSAAGAIITDIWREGLGGCVVCHLEGVACRGPVQAHHIIPKATLRKLGFGVFAMDKRNRLGVCEHRHEQHTTGYMTIPRAALPASVFEFADELSLGWYLDKHYEVTIADFVPARVTRRIENLDGSVSYNFEPIEDES